MGILRRLTNLFRRERLDAEIEEELRAHLELAEEDARQRGMSPEQARRQARLRFGNVLAIREKTADADTSTLLDQAWRDARHGLRQLKRSPAFTIAAVTTLALGIGATTAVFNLIQQVMLRSLPVAQPEELWRVGDSVRCCFYNGYRQDDWSFFSWEAYRHFRANTPDFESLAALQVGQAQLVVRRAGSAASAEPRVGEYISGNFFETFGVPAWRGRLFIDADDEDGAPPVAVMSYRTWASKYGSDPSVIGATWNINGHPFIIVGIAPPGFFGAKITSSGMPELWLPLSTEPLITGPTSRLRNPALAWLDLIGRVRPGTDPKTLEAQLQVELRQWLASHAAELDPGDGARQARQTLHLTAGGAGISLLREQYRDGLRVLLLAALCVLLVACANVANLLLVRGLKNQPLTALRGALGASRVRLVCQSLVESLTLSVLGAVAGVAVAFAGAKLILGLAFVRSDQWVPVTAAPSAPVLLVAIGVSVITAVAFGVVPAYLTSRADPIDALHHAGRSAIGTHRWTQKGFVVLQAAVSLVLLSAAAMLGQSLRNLERRDFGFEASDRYLASMDTRIANIPSDELTMRVRAIEERVRAIPGVRAANSALYAPLSGLFWGHRIRVDGRAEPQANEDNASAWTRVTPGFFETIGDRIVAGRPIAEADNATSRRVAVINQAFARKFFGSENPLGRHFGPASGTDFALYEVVGIAADIDFFGNASEPARPMYFVPHAQGARFDEPELQAREIWSHYPYNVVIWAPGNPRNLEAQVKTALAQVAPDVVFGDVRSYSRVIQERFAQQQMIASLASLFGVIGLVLAGVGLYGVTAYGVEQRRREIGVRMALGADRRSVLALVLKGATTQVAVGLALGIPAAIGAGHLMASQLFGVTPWGGWLLFGAVVVLGLATVIAAVIPARRAASVTPMNALRSE